MKRFCDVFCIAILIFLSSAAIGRSQDDDQSYYDLLHEGKGLQRRSASLYLSALWEQESQLNQIIPADEGKVTRLEAVIPLESEACATADARLGAATARLAEHLIDQQRAVNELQPQLVAAQTSLDALSNSGDQIYGQIIGDLETIAYWSEQMEMYEGWDDTAMVQELQTLIDDANEDIGVCGAILDGLQARYDEVQQNYDDIDARLWAIDSQIQDDQAAVGSAQSVLDATQAVYAVDFQELQNTQGELDRARITLSVARDISRIQEQTFSVQDAWLNANPTYTAWLNNGRPE